MDDFLDQYSVPLFKPFDKFTFSLNYVKVFLLLILVSADQNEIFSLTLQCDLDMSKSFRYNLEFKLRF